jgi:hypothetical protein
VNVRPSPVGGEANTTGYALAETAALGEADVSGGGSLERCSDMLNGTNGFSSLHPRQPIAPRSVARRPVTAVGRGETRCKARDLALGLRIVRAPLVEGIDYYVEDGKYVFTEVYHLKRGHCCNSGCRHCPYTPKGGVRAPLVPARQLVSGRRT